VVRLLTGGEPIRDYRGRKDVVAIRWNGKDFKLNVKDYDFAEKIANELMDEWAIPERTMADFLSPETILKFHDMAAKRIAKNRGDDGKKKKKGILMLKDTGGSGWWRMVNPTRYMDLKGYFVDISASAVEFDQCLEYDVIFVQRRHEWEDYYMLEKLKKARRRIVYDLDDDIFQIPDHNPSSKVMGRDQQFAARACMRLADVVTVSTEVLKSRVLAELGEDADNADVRVIPNALDPTEPWLPTDETGSPDGNLRLFWQGSATHAEDWHECIEAIDTMMGEFPNLRLMILGFLPPVIAERAESELYKGRIEFMGFSQPESYFELIKHVRADVGVAPLTDEAFNHGKSAIKVIENSLIGIPSVASNCEPYSSVVEHGVTGYLAKNQREWEACLRELLMNADRRKKMVQQSREQVDDEFNINTVVELWEDALTDS
jgi:glycosyltransferase involved in cell wall biosynthesis